MKITIFSTSEGAHPLQTPPVPTCTEVLSVLNLGAPSFKKILDLPLFTPPSLRITISRNTCYLSVKLICFLFQWLMFRKCFPASCHGVSRGWFSLMGSPSSMYYTCAHISLPVDYASSMNVSCITHNVISMLTFIAFSCRALKWVSLYKQKWLDLFSMGLPFPQYIPTHKILEWLLSWVITRSQWELG